jgi:uncharacterized membrane protein YfcA
VRWIESYGRLAKRAAQLPRPRRVQVGDRESDMLVLGLFLLVMVPVRRRWLRQRLRIGLPTLMLAAAAIGCLTGIVAATGPINAPLCLGYGLIKGAYLSTEALASATVYLTKVGMFRAGRALPDALLAQGARVGCSLMAGSWIAKRIVQRMRPGDFRAVMDLLLGVAGLTLLAQALRPG